MRSSMQTETPLVAPGTCRSAKRSPFDLILITFSCFASTLTRSPLDMMSKSNNDFPGSTPTAPLRPEVMKPIALTARFLSTGIVQSKIRSGSSTELIQIGGGSSLQMTVVFSVQIRCSAWAIQAATNASQSFQIPFPIRHICDKGVPVSGKMEPNSIASARQRISTCRCTSSCCFSPQSMRHSFQPVEQRTFIISSCTSTFLISLRIRCNYCTAFLDLVMQSMIRTSCLCVTDSLKILFQHPPNSGQPIAKQIQRMHMNSDLGSMRQNFKPSIQRSLPHDALCQCLGRAPAGVLPSDAAAVGQ
ncbi:hypothetical protein T06_16525 [Trichinella sp. T6]|nr:hypothetical protein T06_16525 [Trichinella sp. T6]